MKKIEFENSVSVKSLIDYYGLDEWKNEFVGSGVYRIRLGCRGIIDEVIKMSDDNSVVVKEFDDIVNEIVEGSLDVCNLDYGIEKVKEFVISEFVDWNKEDLGIMYVEGWDEEDCFEYYYVEV
jgi:hypothetical protein